VGFYVDLGPDAVVSGVEMLVETPGTNLDILVADEPGTTVEDWDEVEQARDASGRTLLSFDEPVTTRYLLVLVVAPVPEDAGEGGYRTGINELKILGPETEN
jgi:hypothetical protein